MSHAAFHPDELTRRWGTAIISVPTAVTGYFGQNVCPGSGKAWGFWAPLVVMAAIGSVLYRGFRRRGWL